MYNENTKEVQVCQNENSTMMDLKKKIDDDSDDMDPQLIGPPMYLVNTRLVSCHPVNFLSHFMSQSRQTH
jgi:hypothetical protein